MKVLQVNCVYNKGSTGKITYDIHTELQKHGIESVVCYGRGAKTTDPNVYKTCGELYSKFNNLLSRFTGIMYGGCFFSTNKLISIIKKEQPDIVHLHCINGYFVNIYRLITWLKKHRIKTVLTLHAEFMHTANCGCALDCDKWKTGCKNCPRWKKETKALLFCGTSRSWSKMKKAFDGFDTLKVVSVSNWLAKRAAESPILKNTDIRVIYNGIRTDLFSQEGAADDREYLQQQYRIPSDKKVVLHVTPGYDNPVKGGKYFTQLADFLPAEYQAVVVGCSHPISDRILSIPFTANQQDLAKIYRAASVFVITSIADNYPTVCLEANCCGTPVVGFDVGGINEAIDEGLGEVVPALDVNTLLSRALFWSSQKPLLPESSISIRRAFCCKTRMVHEYLALYTTLTNSSTPK